MAITERIREILSWYGSDSPGTLTNLSRMLAAGTLGGTEQHEYTVIGDAVNLASRIEGLTKEHRMDLLISAPVFEAVRAKFTGERVASCQVKGRDEVVEVYRIIGER